MLRLTFTLAGVKLLYVQIGPDDEADEEPEPGAMFYLSADTERAPDEVEVEAFGFR